MEEYDTNWDSEAYFTVSGQNSNNSVRVPTAFFDALAAGRDWYLTRRTDGKVAKALPASELWEKSPAPPGRAPTRASSSTHHQRVAHLPEDGRINASNPCSEYMFLDDTACNLASINLVRFLAARTAASTSRGTVTRSACGRSCSRSRC